MKAVRIHDFGGPEVLKIEDLPIPSPGDDEVLIRVYAASVNPVDYKTRAGKFPMVPREKLPITLGRDVSGVVERCGKSAGYIKPGDAVYVLLDYAHGGYAQYVTVKAELCALKPPNLSHIEAAALPLAALTAFQGLFDHGRLEANQRVLIHGGAGGVGHIAIQLAKAKGARVCTTVGSDDMEFVSSIGADEAVDYQSERFEDVLKEVDLVFDLIGGETQTRSWKLVKRGGALVSTVAPPSEEEAKKRSARVARYLAEPRAAQLAEVARLVETDEVRPHVMTTLALEQAATAQDKLEKQHTRGKIVLIVHEA